MQLYWQHSPDAPTATPAPATDMPWLNQTLICLARTVGVCGLQGKAACSHRRCFIPWGSSSFGWPSLHPCLGGNWAAGAITANVMRWASSWQAQGGGGGVGGGMVSQGSSGLTRPPPPTPSNHQTSEAMTPTQPTHDFPHKHTHLGAGPWQPGQRHSHCTAELS